ncbi:hypothetical protein PPRY_a4292 [Pseudoalteromonas prydzensis ACAM 620]|nr:hypothetical protein [Pseudoalteromonas prydzensis ACAM 620]
MACHRVSKCGVVFVRQQAQRLRVLSCTLMCNLLLVGEWLATAF